MCPSLLDDCPFFHSYNVRFLLLFLDDKERDKDAGDMDPVSQRLTSLQKQYNIENKVRFIQTGVGCCISLNKNISLLKMTPVFKCSVCHGQYLLSSGCTCAVDCKIEIYVCVFYFASPRFRQGRQVNHFIKTFHSKTQVQIHFKYKPVYITNTFQTL